MEYYIKSKEDYLYTLKRLEKKCSYIEISLMGNVLVNDIILNCMDDVIYRKKIEKDDTEDSLVGIKASKELYKVLENYIPVWRYNEVYNSLALNEIISFYDKDNNLIFSGNKNDDWVSIDEVSPYVIYATLSVEDKNFYKHNGFDYLRIGKALFEDLKSFKIVQGASTITQQYAKNLFLDFDKSWKRKWKSFSYNDYNFINTFWSNH